jgi:hypothetical protein
MKRKAEEMTDHSAAETYHMENEEEALTPLKSTISVVDRLFSAVNSVTTARHISTNLGEITPTTTIKQTVITILMANDVYDIAP